LREGIAHVQVAEDILEAHAGALGKDLTAYKNHVMRVLRFFRLLGGDCTEHVVIAASFHDLGIWTAGTFDYLEPSVLLAEKYLEATDRSDHVDEVTAVIVNHHKLRPYRGPFEDSVERFRRADLADVSLGLIRSGLTRAEVRSVRSQLPNSGFHRRLFDLTLRQFLRHPLHPLPMVRL
jgi:hypothetical protein